MVEELTIFLELVLKGLQSSSAPRSRTRVQARGYKFKLFLVAANTVDSIHDSSSVHWASSPPTWVQ